MNDDILAFVINNNEDLNKQNMLMKGKECEKVT